MCMKHEYKRVATLLYLAIWKAWRVQVLGRYDENIGISSFGQLVKQVTWAEPYRLANCICWLVDNNCPCSGQSAIRRLHKAYRKAVIDDDTQVPASWLNQVEIYTSIMQRKALTLNNFADQ